MNEKKNIIILLVIVFLISYLFCQMNNTKEKFSSTSIGTTTTSTNSELLELEERLNNRINNQVHKRIFELSSEKITESIKNLGIISKKLLENGELDIPGDLNIHTNLTVGNNVDVKNDLNVSNNMNIMNNLTVDGNFNLLPEGTIVMWGQEEIPQGWVLCDGSAHLRKEFLNEVSDELPLVFTNELALTLNKATRDKYIFTPNLGGRFILGAGKPDLVNNIPNDGGLVPTGYINGTSYNLNETGGERRHKLTESELAPHTHRLPKDNQGDTRVNVQSMIHSDNHDERYNNDGNNTCPNCKGKEHNNMPPYHVLNYIMKVY